MKISNTRAHLVVEHETLPVSSGTLFKCELSRCAENEKYYQSWALAMQHLIIMNNVSHLFSWRTWRSSPYNPPYHPCLGATQTNRHDCSLLEVRMELVLSIGFWISAVGQLDFGALHTLSSKNKSMLWRYSPELLGGGGGGNRVRKSRPQDTLKMVWR